MRTGNVANSTKTPPELPGSGERDIVKSVGPVGVRLRGSYSFWLDVRVPEPEHLRAEKVRLPQDILDRLSRLEHVCEAVLFSARAVGGDTGLVLTVLDHLYYRYYVHSSLWPQRESDRDVRAASGYLRASANRSWPAGRATFPAVAGPGFSDELSYYYDHVREGYPEVNDRCPPLGAPCKLLVGVVPGIGTFYHPPHSGLQRGRLAFLRDRAD